MLVRMAILMWLVLIPLQNGWGADAEPVAQSEPCSMPLDPDTLKAGELPTLLLMQHDGTGLRRLTGRSPFDGQGSPRWSSDGKWITFDAWRASAGDHFTTSHIFTVAADGRHLQKLCDGALSSFSPDATLLSFCRYQPFGVWTIRRDGTDLEVIDRTGWCGTWSPDGQSIAYTVGNSQVAIYNVTTGEKRSLFDERTAQRLREVHWGFQWSPDGRALCFHAHTDLGSELIVVDVRGSQFGLELLSRRDMGNHVAWHPDGQRIVCSLERPAGLAELHVLDRRSPDKFSRVPGQPKQALNTSGCWSPDGQQMVFVSYLSPDKEVSDHLPTPKTTD